MIIKNIIFLVLNFTALAIGGLFTNSGVSSEWYQQLNKAPWTPPGWVFGVAWSLIMVCLAVYMAYLLQTQIDKKTVIILFVIQWILNVVWNPVFFNLHGIFLGLVCISFLTIIVAYVFFAYWKELNIKSLFVAPYLIWLLIATSLNAYIAINN